MGWGVVRNRGFSPLQSQCIEYTEEGVDGVRWGVVRNRGCIEYREEGVDGVGCASVWCGYTHTHTHTHVRTRTPTRSGQRTCSGSSLSVDKYLAPWFKPEAGRRPPDWLKLSEEDDFFLLIL